MHVVFLSLYSLYSFTLSNNSILYSYVSNILITTLLNYIDFKTPRNLSGTPCFSLSTACTFAPHFAKKIAHSSWPASAATNNGVDPQLSLSSIFVPNSVSSRKQHFQNGQPPLTRRSMRRRVPARVLRVHVRACFD